MRHLTLGSRLPDVVARRLFGDRRRWGLTVQPDDPDWKAWLEAYLQFYDDTQKRSIGARVNDAGYHIMGEADLDGRAVLEVGPGDIHHLSCWSGTPRRYALADLDPRLLARSAERLAARGVRAEQHALPERRGRLPFADGEFDVIVSFYAFEHLYPFEEHLDELLRVLRPCGRIVGGIPTEGGVGWGLGRYLTSRRWLRRNTAIDPDKIICWEHPNFAADILEALDRRMQRQVLRYWPSRVPLLDVNLIVSFIYGKRD